MNSEMADERWVRRLTRIEVPVILSAKTQSLAARTEIQNR
jgi:hypothetical protein